MSSQRNWHSHDDELVRIVEGGSRGGTPYSARE
jgi:uncharacterized cupin superfamily protein